MSETDDDLTTGIPQMDEGGFSTRQGRLLILSLTVGAAAMMGTAWWYYQHQREATEAAAENQLVAIADFKTAQIANWRRERIGDGRVLAASPLMRSAQRALSVAHAAETDRTDIASVAGRLSREFQYADVALVDLDGVARIRLNQGGASNQLSPHALRGLAGEAVRNHDVVLSDLTADTRFKRPMMAVVIPVGGLGALILEIDPGAFLYPYLQAWPTPSRTAETFLLRIDSDTTLVLSELRYAPGSALVLRTPYSPAEKPDEGRLRSGWFHKSSDYRGVPALKVTRRVPDSPWYLTAKIDQSEVEDPLTRLSWEMALVVVLIAAANVTGAGLIWRNRQIQALREREEWFRRVANDTPAYLMMSATGKRFFLNKALRGFLGTSDEFRVLDGRHLHPEEREKVLAEFLDCVATRRECAAECRVRRFDGEYRWVAIHGLARFSPQGEFFGYATSIVDITERKEAETQLRSANRVLARELEEHTRSKQEIQDLTARLINAQEEERTRLARELHDDISQQVAALSIGVSK